MVLRTALGAVALATAATVAGCSGGGSGGGVAPATGGASATTSGTAAGATSGSVAPAASRVDVARLVADYQARKQAYLQHSASGGGYYAQISRLSVNGGAPDRAPLTAMMDFIDRRPDTADFKATALVRLVYLHEQHPDLPNDLRQRAKRTLLGFKYWPDEPGTDEMIYWSENHQILFASCDYLVGQRWPTETFSNDGRTGAEHRDRAKQRVLTWLEHRLRFGFSEWSSPVYYSHDLSPLLNLVDFAADPDVRVRAEMAVDLLVFDLARFTQRGSFGVTAGRVSEPKYAQSGRGQSVADAIELLFGTRGGWKGRGSTAGTPLATSRYRPPPVLLAIGRDRPARSIDRTRQSLDFSEGPAHGIGFSSFEDGMFWWGCEALVTADTLALSKRMIDAWDLWNYGALAPLRPLRFVPGPLLAAAAAPLSPALEAPLLTRADTYTFRTPDAMLSSVQDYRKGRVGAQQLAWMATFDLDACVWTNAPGGSLLSSFGATGDWNGSSSQPRVVQVEDVAVILYNPDDLLRNVFPPRTHAWFPRLRFDEVRDVGPWTFAREGDGYLALYSARPTRWTTTGPDADVELDAPNGWRNVWICQVGNRAEDGSFAQFVQAVSSAALTATGDGNQRAVDPLSVRYAAPGVGTLEVAWRGTPTRDGSAIPLRWANRYDGPYAQQRWDDPLLEVRFAGVSLRHDRRAWTRTGTGL